MENESTPKRQKSQLGFQYLTDELGHIVETRPAFTGSGEVTSFLPPLHKPYFPDHVDTPEKKKKWDAYWESVRGWWESERAQERRDRW